MRDVSRARIFGCKGVVYGYPKTWKMRLSFGSFLITLWIAPVVAELTDPSAVSVGDFVWYAIWVIVI